MLTGIPPVALAVIGDGIGSKSQTLRPFYAVRYGSIGIEGKLSMGMAVDQIHSFSPFLVYFIIIAHNEANFHCFLKKVNSGKLLVSCAGDAAPTRISVIYCVICGRPMGVPAKHYALITEKAILTLRDRYDIIISIMWGVPILQQNGGFYYESSCNCYR